MGSPREERKRERETPVHVYAFCKSAFTCSTQYQSEMGAGFFVCLCVVVFFLHCI